MGNTGGRPRMPSHEKLTCAMKVNFTPTDFQLLEIAAEQTEQTPTEFVRSCCRAWFDAHLLRRERPQEPKPEVNLNPESTFILIDRDYIWNKLPSKVVLRRMCAGTSVFTSKKQVMYRKLYEEDIQRETERLLDLLWKGGRVRTPHGYFTCWQYDKDLFVEVPQQERGIYSHSQYSFLKKNVSFVENLFPQDRRGEFVIFMSRPRCLLEQVVQDILCWERFLMARDRKIPDVIYKSGNSVDRSKPYTHGWYDGFEN